MQTPLMLGLSAGLGLPLSLTLGLPAGLGLPLSLTLGWLGLAAVHREGASGSL